MNAAPASASVAGNVAGTPGPGWPRTLPGCRTARRWPGRRSSARPTAATTRTVSIRPVQGVVSLEPGQSFHQNAIMATAGSANVDIGPRISSDVSVLPVPRARAKKTTAASSRPPRPSQGCAARRWRCRSASALGCRCGGVVSAGRRAAAPAAAAQQAGWPRPAGARPVTSGPACSCRGSAGPVAAAPAGARRRSAVRGPGSRWRGRPRWRSRRRSRPARSPRRP